MVRALHAAGIEVVLDVVYNHTAEADQLGPMLSSRASTIAATTDSSRTPASTRTTRAAATRCTWCSAHVLRLITDSLRYWVTEMGVDGFRFDLAAALARSMHDVDMLSPFWR